MKDPWIERWDERYKNAEYAYGTAPNNFFREQLEHLKPGKILFPAEGEGRNAVYAATQGWDVSAFDISKEGRIKALELAASNKVNINYQVGEFNSLNYQPGQFDTIALIFAHFPADIKSEIHKSLDGLLHAGGYIIFEAFSKRHIEFNSKNEGIGGPKDVNQLFSIEEISADFPAYEVLLLEELEVDLSEGVYHNGRGSVNRFVGRKK